MIQGNREMESNLQLSVSSKCSKPNMGTQYRGEAETGQAQQSCVSKSHPAQTDLRESLTVHVELHMH